MLDCDIDRAIDMRRRPFEVIGGYDIYSSIHPFTNENVRECFHLFGFDGKNVLTVGSSFDQGLEAILHGAKSVTAFDVNRLIQYYIAFKIASIKKFDYETFLSFYFDCPFEKKRFYEIIGTLDGDFFAFWKAIYDSKSEIPILESQLFHSSFIFPSSFKELKRMIGYFEKESYMKLKESLKDCHIEFVSASVMELPDVIETVYDFVYLSNIWHYMMFCEDDCYRFDDSFVSFVKNQMSDFLKPGGTIVAAYEWGNGDENISLLDSSFELYEFPGVLSDVKDSVQVYRKL